ncbi:nitroreductase family protein [Alkaliphilus peptidifermentans]|uniref:Nitroreductase family protein n=1 Tax=Alkaliphilus peptidifermentans DSM 18978 TaxID=1120976 RepID=A0A1G5FW06_9FIRM|nr:nitroreductase family protein [Alkaliphilus peptidifermentans]SCY43485.1 Nitroreductase family protein [Alkaliphilus peptidifermentans DSM 18978]
MNNNQIFDKSIMEIIKERRSVRTYEAKKLPQKVVESLISYGKEVEGPFDVKVRFELIDDLEAIEKSGNKVGTYGVISGANAYLAAAAEDKEYNLEQVGYTLEKLILYATSLELGTCWLGGTFKRNGFEDIIGLKENEILPVVTPVGYPSSRKRILDSFMRLAAGSNNRKEWSDLFFEKSFNSPLRKEAAGQYYLALEMIRLAPSASNKQPWRILINEDGCHFYLDSTKGYSKALGFNIQRIDMGIAMCHFELTMKEFGEKGRWGFIQQNDKLASNITYIISWIK